MKNTILKITSLGLLLIAITVAPSVTRAADTTTPPAAAPAKSKKAASLPFNGKVAAVDTNAMTLTVGKRTFDVTSETKITKNGQPATLADGVVGETASGSYKKATDGKLGATTVTFTTKAETKKKKKTAAETAVTSTNAVAK